jgi:uncharacterized membrane protein (DUF106 family)
MSGSNRPLPSAADVEEAPEEEEGTEVETTEEAPEAAETPAAPAPRPPPKPFKVTTFVYIFCGLMGLWMLFDTSMRTSIACALGMLNSSCPVGTGQWGLYWLIGFQSRYLLLTMALAGAMEMLITSVAYNYTTDWVKAARVQKWSAAFRKVQMEAIRSGKKDRIAALKPQQEKLTRLSGEVSIAQFKGMAITYFLLILIYSWVWLVITGAAPYYQTVHLGGASIDLASTLWGPIPWWFLIFSLYTMPFSLVFRRYLKHIWLRRYASEHHLSLATPPLAPSGR